eukprot:Nk52_evm1s616 gene=Nk52_evmTU1s616
MRPDQFMKSTVEELCFLEINGLTVFNSNKGLLEELKLRILWDAGDTRIANPLKGVMQMPNLLCCLVCMHPGVLWSWYCTTYYGLHFFHVDVDQDPEIMNAYAEEFLSDARFRATLMERTPAPLLSYFGASDVQIQSYVDDDIVPTAEEMIQWGRDMGEVPRKSNEFYQECLDDQREAAHTGINLQYYPPLQKLPYLYQWARSLLDPLHVLGHQFDNLKQAHCGYV